MNYCGGRYIQINVIQYRGRGINHEQKGIPWQDSIQYCLYHNGDKVFVLSDGAGSSQFAQLASAASSQSIINFFEDLDFDKFMSCNKKTQIKNVLSACVEGIRKEQQKIGCYENKEFLATLLFVFIHEEHMLIGHVGDGAIFGSWKGDLIYQSRPENVSGISNLTYFTLSSNALEHLRLDWINLQETPCDYLLLTSDGAYTMLTNRGGGNPEETFLELEGYCRDGTIVCDKDLEIALCQMTQVPADRMDDWSMIIFDSEQLQQEYRDINIVSMLNEELEKMREEDNISFENSSIGEEILSDKECLSMEYKDNRNENNSQSTTKKTQFSDSITLVLTDNVDTEIVSKEFFAENKKSLKYEDDLNHKKKYVTKASGNEKKHTHKQNCFTFIFCWICKVFSYIIEHWRNL